MSAPVISSLLETDLYKFTMWQALLHRHPETVGEYRFVCRKQPAMPLAALRDELECELDHLCHLRFLPEELEYLGTLRFLRRDFLDFLRIFRFHRDYIQTTQDSDGALQIHVRGPMVHVMGFEIFVLAIVNELYFRKLDSPQVRAEGERRLQAKIQQLKAYAAHSDPAAFPLTLFEFGLRRRFSAEWQKHVLIQLVTQLPQVVRGTSNVHLARSLGLVPIGTMAHEYLQAYQAMPRVRLRDSQRSALEDWVHEYRGDLGIALTDVINMDAFLRDFDLYFAKLFDGLRHDSGDAFVWAEKAIAHYQSLRIDPRSKRLVFSDGLDVDKVIALHRAFAQRTQPFFGVGTSLSNDLGLEPLRIVMKLVRCNDQPVAKLSDEPGKTLCDDDTFLRYLRQVFLLDATA